MKIPLIYLGVMLTAGAFVGNYARLIADKSLKTGLQYGLLFGVGGGLLLGRIVRD